MPIQDRDTMSDNRYGFGVGNAHLGLCGGSFEHSWLAVMAAGICMAAISMIRKDKRDSENKDRS